MAPSYTDEAFLQIYEHEWARRDKHDSNDSFLLACTALLGGVGVYYAKLFPSGDVDVAGGVFAGLCLLYFLAFAGAAVCLAVATRPRVVDHMAPPQEIQAYAEGLRAFYGFNEQEEALLLAAVDREMVGYMRSQHVKCGTSLRRANLTKVAWQTRCKSCLVLAVMILLVNAVPAFFVQRSRRDVQNVRILKADKADSPAAGEEKQ